METDRRHNISQQWRQEDKDVDVEDLHLEALAEGQETYADPTTGLTVFTELAHRRRGYCCGSRCRHCPYRDWNNNNDRTNNGHSGDEAETFLDRTASSIETDREQFYSSADGTPKITCNGTPTRFLIASSTIKTATDSNSEEATKTTKKNKKKSVPYTRTGDGGTSQLMTGERRSKGSAVFDALGTVDELCATVGLAHSFIVVSTDTASAAVNTNVSNPDYPLNNTHPVENAHDSSIDLEESLVQVMSRLFDIGSHIAKPRKLPSIRSAGGGVDDDDEDSDSEASRGVAVDRGEPAFVPDGVGGGFDDAHVDQLEGWIDSMTDDLPELRSFILPSGTVASAQLQVARCVCRRAERLVVPLVQEGTCDPSAVRYLNRLSDYLFVAARWINCKQGGEEIVYKRPTTTSTQRVAVREKS
jgi:cob(I)alamin adenosyltransferase